MKLSYSKMELTVSDLLERGRSGAQIGEELGVCSGTVYQLIRRIREKQKARMLANIAEINDTEEASLP